MKSNVFICTLLCASWACFFISCTNDSNVHDMNINIHQVKSHTDTICKKIQLRLNELEEKYSTRIVFNDKVNITSLTDFHLIEIEKQLLNRKVNYQSKVRNNTDSYINNNNAILLDDTSLDDVSLKTSSLIETYSGGYDLTIFSTDFSIVVAYITWYSNDSQGLIDVEASVQLGSADYILITSYQQIAGANNNPYFSYSADIYTFESGLIGSFNHYYDGANSSTIYL